MSCDTASAVKLLTEQEGAVIEQDRFQELVLSELSDIKDRIAGIENRLTAVETKLDARDKFRLNFRNWLAIAIAIGAVVVAWLK